MNDSIRSLCERCHKLDLSDLQHIKNLFKLNGQLIRHLNAVFTLTMSVFLLYFLKGILIDIIDSTPTLVSTLFALTLSTYLDKLEVQKNDSKISIPEVLPWLELTGGATVRCVAADTLVIILKLTLIVMILWHMHDINHESRAAPIMLNDLVTKFDQPIPDELDHSVSFECTLFWLTLNCGQSRALRHYMESRLDNTDRPNLVYIHLLDMIPLLSNSLSHHVLLLRLT